LDQLAHALPLLGVEVCRGYQFYLLYVRFTIVINFLTVLPNSGKSRVHFNRNSLITHQSQIEILIPRKSVLRLIRQRKHFYQTRFSSLFELVEVIIRLYVRKRAIRCHVTSLFFLVGV